MRLNTYYSRPLKEGDAWRKAHWSFPASYTACLRLSLAPLLLNRDNIAWLVPVLKQSAFGKLHGFGAQKTLLQPGFNKVLNRTLGPIQKPENQRMHGNGIDRA